MAVLPTNQLQMSLYEPAQLCVSNAFNTREARAEPQFFFCIH